MGGPSHQMQLNIQDDHSLSYSSPSLSTTPNRVGNPSSSSRSFDVWGFPKAPSTQTGRQIASRIVYRDARGLVDGTDLVASRTAESVASSASDDEGPKLLEGRQSGEESNDSEVDTARSRKKGKGKAETPPSRSSPQRRKRVIELPYDGDDDDNQSDPTPLPSTTQRPHSSPRKADLGAEGSRGRSRSTSLFDCVWVDNSRFSSPTKKSSVASSPTKTPRSVMASPSKKVPPLETLVLSSSGSGTEDPEEDDDDDEEEGHNPRRSQSKCDAYLFDSEAEEASESFSGSSEAVLKSRPTPTARSQLSSSRKRVVESESGTESKTEEEDVLPRSSTRSARRTQTKATASSRKRPASTSSSEISEESVGHRRIITSVPQPKKQKVLSTRSPPRRRFPSTTPSSKRKSVKEVAKKRERKRSDDEESENESDEAFIVNEDDDDDDDDEPVRSSSGKKSGRGSPKREKAKKGSIRTPTPSSGSESESEGDDNNGGSQQQDDDGTNSGDEDDLELSGEETMLPDDARRGSNKISKFAKLRMEREQKRYESMRRKRRVVDSDNDEPASTHHVARSYLGASEEEDAQDKDEDTDEGEDYSTQNGQTTDLDADIPGFIVDEDEDDQSETDRALVQDIRRRTLGKSQGPMYHFKVFLSWIVRSIIAPEIDWLADEEMLEAHTKVHEIYRDHLNSLLGSSAWTPVFRAAIKIRPTFILHEIDDALRATSCDACVMGRHRASIFRAELSGEAYDHKTLSPLNRKARKQLVHQLALENDNHSEKALKLLVDASQTLDFNLGKFCASRSQTYHELHHRPYSVRKELVDELKEVRREVEGIEEGEGEGGERGRKDEWERRIGREAERCVQVLEEKKVTTRLAKSMQDELATATRLFATSG
ncbi:BQ5605_C016g08141 [Microbotryum silenes-dioicae]|uniref:BQ5605_C016g08141 protein n=1 Tax=Microbotryum silenes-dioicae TaxID=796604 RepID=A0A2X0NZG3_9BASI|nr:BQ5605_C016g08141 [Microbotryum silenes-dioicae]